MSHIFRATSLFFGLIAAACSAFAEGDAVYRPSQDSYSSAQSKLEKGIAMYLATLEDANTSGAFESARAVIESFYHQAFLYDVKTVSDHDKALKRMYAVLEEDLEQNFSRLSIDDLKILLKAIDEVYGEVSRTDLHNDSRKVGAFVYTTLAVMGGHASWNLGSAFRSYRKKVHHDAIDAEAKEKGSTRPSGFSVSRVCRWALAKMGRAIVSSPGVLWSGTKSGFWFVLTDSAIGGAATFVTYPFFFKKREPYELSDKIVIKKLKPFLLDLIQKKEMSKTLTTPTH